MTVRVQEIWVREDDTHTHTIILRSFCNLVGFGFGYWFSLVWVFLHLRPLETMSTTIAEHVRVITVLVWCVAHGWLVLGLKSTQFMFWLFGLGLAPFQASAPGP